jgi:hypothetical protein
MSAFLLGAADST